MAMKQEIFIGPVGIGGSHPVSVQSMTSVPLADVAATLQQIQALQTAGCDIVRVAILDRDALPYFGQVIARSVLPVVADIHFDAVLALEAIGLGAQGIRINPGNIGSPDKVKDILRLANEREIPIRIGVNSGSIEKKYGHGTASRAGAMVSSVMDKVKFFEDNGFFRIKISLKSPDVPETVHAYRLIAGQCDYPLHLGITEAGTRFSGTIKSAIGIGGLLLDGIGNTIRVSLTADPLEEVRVGREILRVLGLRAGGIELISCPTCGRTSVDLIPLVEEVEKRLNAFKTRKKLQVAVMGCEVNGPGEARQADIGLAFSRNQGYLFRKGHLIEKIAPAEAVDRLIEIVGELCLDEAGKIT